MSVSVDANILVYASNESDPAHGRARALVESLAAGPDVVHLFWPTLLGYLRLVTHPAILPRPLSPGRAEANLTALLERPHVRAHGEGDGFWAIYRDTSGSRARGNAVGEVQLVSLMREHGVRVLYTRDSGYRRFDEIEPRNPID